MVNKTENTSKDKSLIGPMFDSIAWRYDFLNHILSFGIDRYWRRVTIARITKDFLNPRILDVATGTGDLAIEASKIGPLKITGIDISDKMLEIAARKIKANHLEAVVELIRCDSQEICFSDNTFDIAMVAFGVRNFSDPEKGLSEMRRVISDRGLIIVLEFSKPDGYFFEHLFNFYFNNFLPVIGNLFSKDRKAYRYLNESVRNFPEGEDFIQIMKNAGISDISQTRLTRGIVTIYTGVKK